MKVTVTIDCTPEEARTFFGFPDLSALQQQMMHAFQDQLRSQMSMDPDTFLKAWFGTGYQGLSDMQRNWWQQMMKSVTLKTE